MARFRVLLGHIVLCVAVISALLSGCDARSMAESQFMEDLDAITADIQVMYDEVDADFLYWPFLYIAFADIDFDEIPEFFYGYMCLTGMQGKIWYRAYSLKERAMINSEHDSDWSTYIRGDTECAFFADHKNFIEGYYLDEKGTPQFVTKALTGSVVSMQMNYVFIEYSDGALYVSEGLECTEELTPIKRVWSKTTIETLEEDIPRLIEEYKGSR